MIKSITIIGADGHFGQVIVEQLYVLDLMDGVKLYQIDKHSSQRERERAAQADIVVFSVPPKAYESVMREFIPLTRPDTILVDVCTVKIHTVKLLHELADGRPCVAGHPMFGRQSVERNGGLLKGLELVICEQTLPEDSYRRVKTLIAKVGLKLVAMTAEDHDRKQAEEQLLTQYFGRVVAHAGFARSEGGSHTVSAGLFYDAMDIVKDDKVLFEQASDLNPFWPEIEARAERAFVDLRVQTVLRLRNGKH